MSLEHWYAERDRSAARALEMTIGRHHGELGPTIADTERELVRRVTDLLVEHELRRTIDLSNDPESVEASRKRARSIAWVFVHRPEVYVGGRVHEAPDYKFEIRVPEG